MSSLLGSCAMSISRTCRRSQQIGRWIFASKVLMDNTAFVRVDRNPQAFVVLVDLIRDLALAELPVGPAPLLGRGRSPAHLARHVSGSYQDTRRLCTPTPVPR